MKHLRILLAVMAAAFGGLVTALSGRRVAVANGHDTVPHADGRIGRNATEDIGSAHLLLKPDGAGVALNQANDEPLGTSFGKTDAGARVGIATLGGTPGTRAFIAAKAIAADTRIYTSAGGRVTDVSSAGVWLVGKTTEAVSAAGGEVEAVPCFPVQV